MNFNLIVATALLPPWCLMASWLAAPSLVEAGAGDLMIATVAGTGIPALGASEGDALKVNIDQPFGVEIGPGSLYVCAIGHHRVFRLDLQSGRLGTVAGNGQQGTSGDGQPASTASLNEPYEVRLNKDGDLYIVDMAGAVVRKVDRKTGIISTVAGTGEPGFGGDGGPATKAKLHSPHSIALDSIGNIYIADIGNHRLRRVDAATGSMDTIAGNGEKRLPRDGDLAAGSPILGPRALYVTGDVLWIALREGNSLWKLDLSTRRLAHVAGTGKAGFKDGAAGEAEFNGPKGIVHDRGDFLFVADTENQAIRRVELKSGTVSTVAGSGPQAQGYGGDGGPATRAKLDRPHGITAGPGGILYIGDSNNHRVRRLAPRG